MRFPVLILAQKRRDVASWTPMLSLNQNECDEVQDSKSLKMLGFVAILQHGTPVRSSCPSEHRLSISLLPPQHAAACWAADCNVDATAAFLANTRPSTAAIYLPPALIRSASITGAIIYNVVALSASSDITGS